MNLSPAPESTTPQTSPQARIVEGFDYEAEARTRARLEAEEQERNRYGNPSLTLHRGAPESNAYRQCGYLQAVIKDAAQELERLPGLSKAALLQRIESLALKLRGTLTEVGSNV